jgi:hypothetical protein
MGKIGGLMKKRGCPFGTPSSLVLFAVEFVFCKINYAL